MTGLQMAISGGNVRTLIILEKNRTETSKYDNIIKDKSDRILHRTTDIFT